MKKPLIILISLIFLTINSSSQSRTTVNILSKKNFNEKTTAILNKAVKLIDSIINTEKFKEEILKATFTRNTGKSNLEIYNLLISGKEIHSNNANYSLDFILETYPDKKGDNIGSTFGAKRIVTSEAYILKNGARCYAAHLIHEYIHTLGFGHRHKVWFFGHRKKKCQSVPYIIGDIARQMLDVKTCNCECENYQKI